MATESTTLGTASVPKLRLLPTCQCTAPFGRGCELLYLPSYLLAGSQPSRGGLSEDHESEDATLMER
jgi:hypothetical protein